MSEVPQQPEDQGGGGGLFSNLIKPQQPLPQPYEPTPIGQLPGMTPGAGEAATQPMGVQAGTLLNPFMDSAAVQHMMLAAQGIKDFDAFTMRNNVARMVPGKHVKSFLRVPNAIFSPSQAAGIGPYSDVPSDVYVPVMEGEEDRAAYERYMLDQSRWNGPVFGAMRGAQFLVDKALPNFVLGAMRTSTNGLAGYPLALDSLRESLARNAPIYGQEHLDTEGQWLTPDWTWAVFGGAMKGGEVAATAGMIRLAGTEAGQAFLKGFQTAGLNRLGNAGLPLEAPPTGLGKSSSLFQWLGQKVGTKAFASVRPAVLREAEDALRESGAKLRVTAEGLDIGISGPAAPDLGRLRAALQGLKAEMSSAGEKATFRIFTDVPGTFGAAVGGGAGAGIVAADPLARTDLTAEQRKLIAAGIPGSIALGAALPLGFRTAQAALDALAQRGGAAGYETSEHFRGGSPTGLMAYLLEAPKGEPPAPPGPPRILGEGPGPIGLPPARPGPFGPTTPDSGLYTVPLPKIDIPETAGGQSLPSREQFAAETSVRSIEQTLPYIQDPKQLFQVRQFLLTVAAEQGQQVALTEAMGADRSVLETRNKAITARLDTINRLIGKDMTPTSFVLGLPTPSILLDPSMPPEANATEPLRMGLLQWAQGVGEEAARVGIDLPTATAQLPPPMNAWDIPAMTARIQQTAAMVRSVAPDAAVGPPRTLAPDVPDEIRKAPPVHVDPIPSAALPEASTLGIKDFPTARDLRTDPVAVRRQMYAASRLAHGLRFHAGDLVATQPQHLRDTDPFRVPVYQDPAGRLMARVPDPYGTGLADAEVTDDLRRANLPTGAGWHFAQSPLAPVPYVLDHEQELFTLDRQNFDGRDWLRDLYKNGLWSQVQGEFNDSIAPFSNPINAIDALTSAPPTSIEDADGVLDRLSKMSAEHAGKRPTEAMAITEAGPGAPLLAVSLVHGQMLKDYSMMGALIEHARALALAHKARLEFEEDAPYLPMPQSLPPSPFGLQDSLRTERHLRGPVIYAKLMDALNLLPQIATWTPETLMNRLQQGSDLSGMDMQVSGLRDSYDRVAAEQNGTLTTEDAQLVTKDRAHHAFIDGLLASLGVQLPPEEAVAEPGRVTSESSVEKPSDVTFYYTKQGHSFRTRDNMGAYSTPTYIDIRVRGEKVGEISSKRRRFRQPMEWTARFDLPDGSSLELKDTSVNSLKARVQQRLSQGFPPVTAQMAHEGGRAQTRFDPRLIGVLGANQYQGELAAVIAKELLQNAKDSLMGAIERGWTSSTPPYVRVKIHNKDNWIEVADNGLGMSPEVAAKEFVEIGGSYKPSETASGGFGLAKIAYLPNAETIHVVTVAETPDGRMMTHLMGSGEEWSDPERGLKITSTKAPAEQPLGTYVKLKMKPLVQLNSYTASTFLKDFGKHSDLPFDFKAQYLPDWNTDEREANWHTISDGKPDSRNELFRHEDPAFSAVISRKGGPTIDSKYPSIHVLNNGIFQFTTGLSMPEGITVPDEIIANISSKVPIEDPGYPFTTNRETLKQDVTNTLKQRILSEIGLKKREAEIRLYQRILADSPEFPTMPGLHVVDSMQNLPKDLVTEIANDDDMAEVGAHLWDAFNTFIGRLHHLKSAGYGRESGQGTHAYAPENATFHGFGLSRKYYGVNVNGKALGLASNYILINPFQSALALKRLLELHGALPPGEDLQFLAGSMMTTMIHEITHQQEGNDASVAFSAALTHNYGALANENAEFTTALAAALGRNNGRILTKLADYSGRLESHWKTGTDALDSVTTKSGGPAGGGSDQGRPPESGGRGRGQRGALRRGAPGSAPESAAGPTVRSSATSDDEAKARLRSLALANAAAGGSWSGKRGTELFGALTDAERGDALISRLKSGRFVNRRHLLNLSPVQWERTGKFPKYFGAWRPSAAQTTALKDAWNQRLELWNRSESTINQLRSNSAQRAAKGKRPDWISLESITQMDPSHLEDLYKEPNTFDEWVNNFWRVADTITNEAQANPDDKAREAALQKLDIIKDAVRTMAGNRVLAGTHPYDEPPTPYGGLKRIQAWAHNAQAIPQGALRRIGRPSYVVGWRKQILHPKEFAGSQDELARNVFHIMESGYLNQQQETESLIQQTDTLHQAAAKWMSRPAAKTVETGPIILDMSKEPPKSMTPDVVLDRAIHTFLQHRTPAQEIERSPWRHHTVNVGLAGKLLPTKIDLAEWMPKLYKIYNDLISRAEQSELLKAKTEGIKFKARGEAMEAEIRARILWAAQKEEPDASLQSFEQLDVDRVLRLMKQLSATDEGNLAADPWSVGRRPFRNVKATWKSSLRNYHDRKERIDFINGGGLRREGYVTALHKLTLPDVREMLRDPNSVMARYTTPTVRNYYLNERKSDEEPYHSWAASWLLYLPAMMKTIHMQPAFINVAPKLPQLPADLRDYADQMIRRMKGEQTPFDEKMNRLAFSAMIESPTIASQLGKLFGTDLIDQLRTDPEARQNLAGSRVWRQLIETGAGTAYMALMSPTKVAALNVTELGFLVREHMARPQDLLALPATVPYAVARAGVEGLGEFASWLKTVAVGGPRWYSEATLMKVTDALNEMVMERHAHPKPFDAFQSVADKAIWAWYSLLRVTQQPINAACYYDIKAMCKLYGLDEADSRSYAARAAKDLAGLYGPLDTPPNPRGTVGRAVFQFKRFIAAKTDLLAGDVTNATRLLMPQHDMNMALGHAGGSPPPSTPPGMPEAPPPGAGSPPPPPPPLRGSSFGDWTPDERQTWDKFAEPVAPMGSTFGSSRLAQWQSLLKFLGLVFAAYPTIGTVSLLAKLFWREDDINRPGQNIFDMAFPWDYRRLNSIAALWMIEPMGSIAMLEIKKWAPMSGGLSKQEETRLEMQKRQLIEAAWFFGQFLKDRRYELQQEKYDQQKQRAIQRQNSAPPRPHRPSRTAPPPSP